MELKKEAAEMAKSQKGKQKAEPESESDEDVEMDDEEEDKPLKPMPKRQSVADLRAKLHARIEDLRKGRGGGGGTQLERSPKEDLLDEQRREREKVRIEPKEQQQRKGMKSSDQVCSNGRCRELPLTSRAVPRTACWKVSTRRCTLFDTTHSVIRISTILRVRLIIEVQQVETQDVQ